MALSRVNLVIQHDSRRDSYLGMPEKVLMRAAPAVEDSVLADCGQSLLRGCCEKWGDAS